MESQDNFKMEITWEEAVSKAKKLIKNRIDYQMEIAEIAMSVCEITWGGARSAGEDKLTITRFAEEIGMSAFTLSNWISVKKIVKDKIPGENYSYTTMCVAARTLNRHSTREQVLSKITEIEENSIDHTALRALSRCRSLLYVLKQRCGIVRCNRETLEEIMYFIKPMYSLLKKEKIRPINHYRTSASSVGSRIGVARAFSDRSIRITEKDRKILDFMSKEPGKFYSPTEVGMEVGKHNRSSASAWALRSFYKFIQAGMMKKNEEGQYRLTSVSILK